MIKIKVEKPFNLEETVTCGQIFRFFKQEDGSYDIILKDRVINVFMDGNFLCVSANNEKDLKKIVINYFDLDNDYALMDKFLINSDKKIVPAVEFSKGLMMIRQDPFETVMEYIISANNGVPQIASALNNIARKYGKKIDFNDKEYYLFPTPKQLENVSIEDYRNCGVGFRDKYIYDTVMKINQKQVDLDSMQKMNTSNLRKELLNLMGVGPKVADCILLFSCNREEVFPIDVWVERVMEKLYFNNESTTKKKILEYATSHFGSDAGIIQQHLFYNIRENML